MDPKNLASGCIMSYAIHELFKKLSNRLNVLYSCEQTCDVSGAQPETHERDLYASYDSTDS